MIVNVYGADFLTILVELDNKDFYCIDLEIQLDLQDQTYRKSSRSLSGYRLHISQSIDPILNDVFYRQEKKIDEPDSN